MGVVDYTAVTEARGTQITREALDMMWTRYAFAARYCDGCDVLEVACGAGQGLGTLSDRARRVVGGDYTRPLLDMARRQYAGRLPLVQLDAQALPFRSGSFDAVVLYEALYYLHDPPEFIREARRVLRCGGRLVVCTVNREWADFNPSPLSTTYFSHAELREMLCAERFSPSLFGAFPVTRETARDRVVSGIKRAAIRLGLMPRTMRGKRLLKRLFLGELVDFPAEMREGLASYREPVSLAPEEPAPGFKVIYAVGTVLEQ
jgi:SAM-dependent methyltransferase